MNERSRAIDVLKRAQAILAQRLTERILESREEIFDDASGESYLSEIDAIYDEFGSRLVHINALLGNLPAGNKERQGPKHERPAEAKPEPPEPRAMALALPAPKSGALAVHHGAKFRSFAAAIHAGQVDSAGSLLADLFGLDRARAIRCAQVFQERFQEGPEVMLKAMQLRRELEAQSANGPLVLLWECFGLDGFESLAVLELLRARLGRQ